MDINLPVVSVFWKSNQKAQIRRIFHGAISPLRCLGSDFGSVDEETQNQSPTVGKTKPMPGTGVEPVPGIAAFFIFHHVL
jgi:hypothetical protein